MWIKNMILWTAWRPQWRITMRKACLEVVTRTNQRLAVHMVCREVDEKRRVACFPVRLGYACTIPKVQGMTLPHATIWLDSPGCRAAAYVAMSRVRTEAEYLIAGAVSPQHFVPAIWIWHRAKKKVRGVSAADQNRKSRRRKKVSLSYLFRVLVPEQRPQQHQPTGAERGAQDNVIMIWCWCRRRKPKKFFVTFVFCLWSSIGAIAPQPQQQLMDQASLHGKAMTAQVFL